MHSPKIDYSKILNNLMVNWIVNNAIPVIIVLSGLWVSHDWLPLITVIFVPVLTIYGNYYTLHHAASCTLSRRYTEYALIVSAIIMMCFNMADREPWHSMLGLPSIHGAIPYVPAVILYPVLAFFKALQLLRIGKTEYCQACIAHGSSSAENTLINGLYVGQTKRLNKLSLTLSVIVSVVILIYYFSSYININYNIPDKFFFFVFPTVVYVLATGYVFMKFSSMRFGLATLGPQQFKKTTMQIRFLVVREDKMLMEETATSMPGIMFWDTPAIYTLSAGETLDDINPEEVFRDISSVSEFRLRRLYGLFKTDASEQTEVYAAFLPDDAEVPGLGGEWLNLYAIDKLYNSGSLTKQMNYDIHRIYIMTMTWKSYTREGKRLYPIKNYRPTFHLSDFKNWDMDYDDLHWFDVYKNNEDRAFWRLRQFWRRYISGVAGKWRS